MTRRRRLNPDVIICAAARCFYQNGYAETTLATVAEQLNVTDKAIYYYFESKDALYLAAINACMDAVAALIDTIDASEENGLEKIKTFARMIIRHSGKRQPYLKSLPAHLENTEMGRRFRHSERNHEMRLVGWVSEGIEDGSIRPADPQMLWKWNQGALIWLDAWARDIQNFNLDLIEEAAMTMLDRCLAAVPNPQAGQ